MKIQHSSNHDLSEEPRDAMYNVYCYSLDILIESLNLYN